ncbi:unnamed protein product [Amoebophrya sp. A120]|nr:unnamed protein product [Amoebophrya sp. A120]|eukprot:GSA120T00009147001.1
MGGSHGRGVLPASSSSSARNVGPLGLPQNPRRSAATVASQQPPPRGCSFGEIDGGEISAILPAPSMDGYFNTSNNLVHSENGEQSSLFGTTMLNGAANLQQPGAAPPRRNINPNAALVPSSTAASSLRRSPQLQQNQNGAGGQQEQQEIIAHQQRGRTTSNDNNMLICPEILSGDARTSHASTALRPETLPFVAAVPTTSLRGGNNQIVPLSNESGSGGSGGQQQDQYRVNPILVNPVNRQHDSLTKEAVFMIAKEAEIEDLPPEFLYDEPDVYKIICQDKRPAYIYFEAKCRLCDKLCWPEDTRGNTHLDSHNHKRQYAYWKARRRGIEGQRKGQELLALEISKLDAIGGNNTSALSSSSAIIQPEELSFLGPGGAPALGGGHQQLAATAFSGSRTKPPKMTESMARYFQSIDDSVAAAPDATRESVIDESASSEHTRTSRVKRASRREHDKSGRDNGGRGQNKNKNVTSSRPPPSSSAASACTSRYDPGGTIDPRVPGQQQGQRQQHSGRSTTSRANPLLNASCHSSSTTGGNGRGMKTLTQSMLEESASAHLPARHVAQLQQDFSNLEWDAAVAAQDPVPPGFLEAHKEAKTPIEKWNMFSPYNFLRRTYNEKASAVLGRDMDEEIYQAEEVMQDCSLLGAQTGPLLCMGKNVPTDRGRFASGASTYCSQKSHRIAKTDLSQLSRMGPGPGRPKDNSAKYGPAYPRLYSDRESIYSSVTTSNNSVINKSGRVSKVWQDHQAIEKLAKRQPGADAFLARWTYWNQCAGIPNRQLPYEWVILLPGKSLKDCSNGYALRCLLCEASPQDPCTKGVNHTDDGPGYHLKRLKDYISARDDVRRRRWEAIREYSLPYWQQHWDTDEIARLRSEGHFSVYATLWPEEQFAVRTALMYGWKMITEDYLPNGKYSSEQILKQQFSYGEEHLEAMFQIYHEITFGKPNAWEKFVTESDKMTDADSEREENVEAINVMLEEMEQEKNQRRGNYNPDGGEAHASRRNQAAAASTTAGRERVPRSRRSGKENPRGAVLEHVPFGGDTNVVANDDFTLPETTSRAPGQETDVATEKQKHRRDEKKEKKSKSEKHRTKEGREAGYGEREQAREHIAETSSMRRTLDVDDRNDERRAPARRRSEDPREMNKNLVPATMPAAPGQENHDLRPQEDLDLAHNGEDDSRQNQKSEVDSTSSPMKRKLKKEKKDKKSKKDKKYERRRKDEDDEEVHGNRHAGPESDRTSRARNDHDALESKKKMKKEKKTRATSCERCEVDHFSDEGPSASTAPQVHLREPTNRAGKNVLSRDKSKSTMRRVSVESSERSLGSVGGG